MSSLDEEAIYDRLARAFNAQAAADAAIADALERGLSLVPYGPMTLLDHQIEERTEMLGEILKEKRRVRRERRAKYLKKKRGTK